MTAARQFDTGAPVAAITAALKERVDPAYEAGMRRTVPSGQKAHAVRLPEIRRVGAEWSREHKDLPFGAVLAVADALWATEWREERIVAMTIMGRRKEAPSALDWGVIQRWTAAIDNWELVDNMASILTGPMVVIRPALLSGLNDFSASPHVWQRRLAIVTLIEAARDDPAWLPELRAMAAALKGDRGPTMRKAVDWARRAADKVEARRG